MSAITVSDPPIASSNAVSTGSHEDLFRIGWRDIVRPRPDGTSECVQIPLTAEDCLHPREEDVIVESRFHRSLRDYLTNVFEMQLARDPRALVLSDTPIYWDDPALKHHSPDVAAIFDVLENKPNWKSFDVDEQGTRPRLIIEIVSTTTRDNDVVVKFQQYHRARVARYVIIDSVNDQDFRISGHQYTPSQYLQMPTDGFGRLWLDAVGVWLGIANGKVVCYDGQSGEEIGDYVTSQRQLQEQKRFAQAERARADAESAARRAAEERIRELEEQLKLKSGNPPA